jgi:hypothetical protein
MKRGGRTRLSGVDGDIPTVVKSGTRDTDGRSLLIEVHRRTQSADGANHRERIIGQQRAGEHALPLGESCAQVPGS